MTVKLYLDWSAKVYLPVRSSDLFLILGCMTYTFLCFSSSTLHSSFLWRADTTTISANLNKPPLSNSPPSLLSPPPQMFEINKPPGVVNRGFTVDLLFSSLGAEISRYPAAVWLSKKCITDQFLKPKLLGLMSVDSPWSFERGISRGEKCIYRIELQFTHNNIDFGAIY